MLISTSTMIDLNNQVVLAEEEREGKGNLQTQQNQTSVQHNAKGHQTHQVVNLQYPKENLIYNGSVIFKASKPVDIIAYNATLGLKNNAANTWDINGTIYKPMTLLQNSSECNLKFHASGLIIHSPLSQPYTATFNVNSTENDLGED